MDATEISKRRSIPWRKGHAPVGFDLARVPTVIFSIIPQGSAAKRRDGKVDLGTVRGYRPKSEWNGSTVCLQFYCITCFGQQGHA
jgi:hypothetical protein